MTMRKNHGVYLADTARVTGDVTMGDNVSLWYGAVIRGDVAPITIGARTNVQDNAVIHCDHGHANRIGSDVTIGHGAICHGVCIGNGALIGMGATLLGGSKVGEGAIVAAGALLAEGKEVPDGHVAMGVPAKVVRETNDREKAYIAKLPPRYVEEAELYAEGADPLMQPWQGNAGHEFAPDRQRDKSSD